MNHSNLNLGLSRQEERVLLLSMSGKGDKEIAREMGVALDTVRTYWQRMRSKVGGQTRAELVSRLTAHLVENRLQDETRTAFEGRLVSAIDAMADAFLLLDPLHEPGAETRKFVVQVVNHAGTCLLGLPRAEIVGRTLDQVLPEEMADELLSQCALLSSTGMEIDFELVSTHGRRLRIHGRKSEPGIAISVRDTTMEQVCRDRLREKSIELQQLRLMLQSAREKEMLLRGIGDRKSMLHRLETEIAMSARYGQRFSLIVVDVPGLDKHPKAPQLLSLMIDMLRSTVRQTDYISCLEDQRFGVLMPCTCQQGCGILGQRIREMGAPFLAPESLVVRVGCAMYRITNESAQTVLEQAMASLGTCERGGCCPEECSSCANPCDRCIAAIESPSYEVK